MAQFNIIQTSVHTDRQGYYSMGSRFKFDEDGVLNSIGVYIDAASSGTMRLGIFRVSDQSKLEEKTLAINNLGGIKTISGFSTPLIAGEEYCFAFKLTTSENVPFGYRSPYTSLVSEGVTMSSDDNNIRLTYSTSDVLQFPTGTYGTNQVVQFVINATFYTPPNLKVNVSNDWKDSVVKVNVANSWKDVDTIKINVGGVWKETT